MQNLFSKILTPTKMLLAFLAIVTLLTGFGLMNIDKRESLVYSEDYESLFPRYSEVDLKDIDIKIKSVETVTNLGENELLRANAKGVFKVVRVWVKNNKKTLFTIDSYNFRLIDSLGGKFLNSRDGQAAIFTKSLFLKTINPGSEVEGDLVFDVPKGIKDFTLTAGQEHSDSKKSVKID